MLRHSSTNLIYRIIVASCVSITIVNFLHVYISNLLHRFDPWALLSGLRRKATSLGAEYVRGNICGLSKRDQVDGAPAALTSAEVWRGRGRTYRLLYATRSTTGVVLSRTNFYMHFTRKHIYIIRKLFFRYGEHIWISPLNDVMVLFLSVLRDASWFHSRMNSLGVTMWRLKCKLS